MLEATGAAHHLLLFIRPRIGVPSTILLIVTNVIHNLAVTARDVLEGDFLVRVATDPLLLGQIGLLFVAATARTAREGAVPGSGR